MNFDKQVVVSNIFMFTLTWRNIQPRLTFFKWLETTDWNHFSHLLETISGFTSTLGMLFSALPAFGETFGGKFWSFWALGICHGSLFDFFRQKQQATHASDSSQNPTFSERSGIFIYFQDSMLLGGRKIPQGIELVPKMHGKFRGISPKISLFA